jgi:hypothetical protein
MRGATAFLVVLAVMLALGAGTARAAAEPCWHRVLSAWSAGNLDSSYPPACYRTALDHLPEDVAMYSSAQDDIDRALLGAIMRRPAQTATSDPASPVPIVAIATAAGLVVAAAGVGVVRRLAGRGSTSG